MKVMVVWRAVPGKYKPLIEQFLSGGGQYPRGRRPWGAGIRRAPLAAGILSRRTT